MASVTPTQPPAPGQYVLVDHLFVPGCPPGGDAFAGYIASDATGTGASAAFAAEITTMMVVKNVGCCKNPYNGLTVPIYRGAVDAAGKMAESSAPLANMELTFPLCVGPGCKRNMSAVVSRPDGTVLGRFDSKGMALCVTCCADEPLLVTQTEGADFKFGGTTMPCCICPCSDVHFFRRLNNEANEGMTRYWLLPCASGPSRKPVSHRRPPLCFCPCFGSPATAQTYTIATGGTSGTTYGVAPEVFFASAIFEELAYPYHNMKKDNGKGGGDGGGPAAAQMVR